MENRVRELFEGAFKKISSPFHVRPAPVSTKLRLPYNEFYSEGASPSQWDKGLNERPTRSEAQTQTSPDASNATVPNCKNAQLPTPNICSNIRAPTELNTEANDEGEEKASTGDSIQHTVQYTDGSNRIVTINDGTKDCLAFLLTEETVILLAEVVGKRKDVESIASTYQEASKAVSLGQGFLDYSGTMLEEATSQEEYDQIKQDVQQRESEVHRNAERKEAMESELQSRKRELEYSRSQAEDVFEQMLLDAQLIQTIQEEPMADISDRSSSLDSPEDPDIESQQLPVIEDEPNMSDPMEEVKLTRQKLSDVQMEFDQQQQIREQQTREYRQAQQEGLAQYPEIELDLYHVQQGRQITRALIEAEEAYDTARAKARGLGLLGNEPDQESNFVERTDDGVTNTCNPAFIAANFNPTFIQAWAEIVSQSQEKGDTEPDVEDWDARTVTMSDSMSVIAYHKDRRRIDRWRYICDSVREGVWDGDAGAMGRAVLSKPPLSNSNA